MGCATSDVARVFAVISLLHMTAFAGFRPILVPSELMVKDGETVTFACIPFIPFGLPLLEINSVDVTIRNPNPRLSFEDHGFGFEGNRTYFFANVTTDDDGTTFRCQIGSAVSNVITLTVLVLPMVSALSSNETFTEGTDGQLNFLVTGVPYPHLFTWLYNSEPFSGNERVSIVNTTILFRVISREDAGNYSLIVENSIGHDSASTVLEVVYNEFLQTPQDVTLNAGDSVTQICSHRFGREFTWRANTSFIDNQNPKVQTSLFGSRIEYGPVDFRDHSLELRCVTVLSNGAQFISLPGRLTVLSPPNVHGPEGVAVLEGHDVTLDYEVRGHPPANTFTFYYNGRQLLPSGPISILERTSVHIEGVGRSLAGNYTLVAGNSHGEGSWTIQLAVHYAPEITPFRESVVAQVNRSFSLPCGGQIASSPPPHQFTWRYNNQSVSERDRISTVLPSGHLLLPDAAYSDSGAYTCTAVNLIGVATTAVQLLVLDPPTSPENLRLVQTGPTWVHIQWHPPRDNGSLPLSGFRVSAFPQVHLSNGLNEGETENTISGSGQGILSANSVCVEVVCPPMHVSIGSPGRTATNVTGLVPNLEYLLVVVALSNGTNLQSDPSSLLNFTTDIHVPGIGSVTAAVEGPGSVQVTWTLAYSGGLPVQYFDIEFQKLNTTDWRTPVDLETAGSSPSTSIPGTSRSFIIRGLEAEEIYVFRVLGVNELGRGDFTISESLLSHSIGVPSQPAQPGFTGWTANSVFLNTSIPKIGSHIGFAVTVILLQNSTEIARFTETQDNYTEGTELQLEFPNISYSSVYQFQVFASNYLGVSDYSSPTQPAGLAVVEKPSPYVVAGATTGFILGAFNLILVVGLVSYFAVMFRSWCTEKRRLSMRMRMVEASNGEDPSRPTTGESGDSPEGRSNTHATLSEIVCRYGSIAAPTLTLPSSSAQRTATAV